MSYRFIDKNKFAKLVHLFGLIIKNFFTMQGHMNVKFLELIFLKQIVIDYNRTAGKIKRSIAFTFLRLNLYFVLNSHFYRSVI